MALSVSDDVATAVAKKWAADAQLLALVPGGLQRGRLTSFQPNAARGDHPSHPDEQIHPERQMPYATFAVSKLQDNELSTGGQYIDHRKVAIEIRGRRVDASAALERAHALFVQQELKLTAAQGGAAMAVLEITADIMEDPARKEAEDVWIGLLELHVMQHRSY